MGTRARLEEALDGCEAAGAGLASGHLEAAIGAARAHYAAEDEWLARLPEPIRIKLASQHAEVLEVANEIGQSLAAGNGRDVQYLLRRMCALARHNLIEEERDVLPYYDRGI